MSDSTEQSKSEMKEFEAKAEYELKPDWTSEDEADLFTDEDVRRVWASEGLLSDEEETDEEYFTDFDDDYDGEEYSREDEDVEQEDEDQENEEVVILAEVEVEASPMDEQMPEIGDDGTSSADEIPALIDAQMHMDDDKQPELKKKAPADGTGEVVKGTGALSSANRSDDHNDSQ